MMDMNYNVLTDTVEYLVMSEKEADDLVAKAKQEALVESSNIKYKKATAKKMEHWVVTLKLRYNYVEDFVATGE